MGGLEAHGQRLFELCVSSSLGCTIPSWLHSAGGQDRALNEPRLLTWGSGKRRVDRTHRPFRPPPHSPRSPRRPGHPLTCRGTAVPSGPGRCRPRPNLPTPAPGPRSPAPPHRQDARGPPHPRSPPSSSWSSSSGSPVGEGPPALPRHAGHPAPGPGALLQSVEAAQVRCGPGGRLRGPGSPGGARPRSTGRPAPGCEGPARPARALRAPGRGRQRLRPYHPERARSRLISEAKQGRAWLVLGWETAWEYRVL